MNWAKRYKESHHNYARRKTPGFFFASGGDSMLVKYPKVKSSNGLRRAICNYMKWEGHHMEATNNMGRPIQRKVPKMSLVSGQVEYLYGGIMWQKGSGITGSSDAKGHINKRGHEYAIPLYIEIKFGRDTQSQEQKEYEEIINNSGGIYILAKTIEGFFMWYDEFLLT